MEFKNWQDFWRNYRKNKVTEDYLDLFYQVGKTINKLPIQQNIFDQMILDIINKLELNENDILLELCCGNGLLTKPLSFFVNKIYAFDFTEHLISTAKLKNQNENIEYAVGDVKSDFLNLFSISKMPNKYLMNDSLGYFTVSDLEKILINIKKSSFIIYITGIPNDLLKWNFYNTEERKFKYKENVKNGDEFNDGIGRWWKDSELYELSIKLNLKLEIENQHNEISSFRMNAIFTYIS